LEAFAFRGVPELRDGRIRGLMAQSLNPVRIISSSSSSSSSGGGDGGGGGVAIISVLVCMLLVRLCGLVARVSGYRSRGSGFDSRHYQIFSEIVGLERTAFILVKIIEELFE
jgi:hypothetical protein